MGQIRKWLAAVLLACMACTALAQDATLNRARQLIDTKQPKAAFDLLAPLEEGRAGDPQFDYLLGLAALDSGQLTRAVFALERVLAVQPNHPQARAEIARAYYQMGENKLARQEFEAVKRTQPPAQVATTIDQFLDAIDARERRARGTGVAGFIEMGGGHDTNVNAATSVNQFAIPVFGGLLFSLVPGAAELDDNFTTVAAGVNGRYALDDTFGLVGSAGIDNRWNRDFDVFDTGSINLSGGVSWKGARSEFVVAAQGQVYYVDQTRFREAFGVVGQWRYSVGLDDQLTAYVQQTRLEYPTQGFRDADRTVIGAGWAHAFGPTISFVGIYGGREDEKDQTLPQFGHDLYGVRVGLQSAVAEKLTLFLSLSYEERKYGGPDPLFLVNRKDKQADARVAANYALSASWSVTAAAQFTDNNSNIVINDYDRAVYSVTLRYDFR